MHDLDLRRSHGCRDERLSCAVMYKMNMLAED